MENAILGMRTLNISQGYFSNNTHKNLYQVDLAGEDTGIDAWRAKNHWKVLNILPYSTTGFANTVFFGSCDASGNKVEVMTPGYGPMVLTLAMTHDNVISSKIKVGAIFSGDDMIYEEGTTGKATGNHIHLECAKGWVTNKIKYTGSKYYGGAQWCMQNTLPIEKCLYLLNGYNRVFNDNGYNFQWVDSIEHTGGTYTSIQKGYSKVVWNNNVVHCYRQDIANRDIGMMSAKGSDPMTALQKITEIDDTRKHYAKMNCGYFQMQRNASDPYGYHYGVEQTPTINAVPRQGNNYLAFYITPDNKPHVVYSSEYWLNPPKDVKLAFTPACVMLLDGKDYDLYSVGLGDKRNIQNTQSMLLRLTEDGSYIFAVTDNDNWNAYNCRNFAKDMGCDLCVLCDSGGSSQLVADGNAVVYTGREIPNVLTIFVTGTDKGLWPETSEPEPTPDPKPEEPSEPSESEEDYKKLYEETMELLDKYIRENKTLKTDLDEANKNIQSLNEENADYILQLNEANNSITSLNNKIEEMNKIMKEDAQYMIDFCSTMLNTISDFKKTAEEYLDDLDGGIFG